MFKVAIFVCALIVSGCSSSKQPDVGAPTFDVPETALTGQAFSIPKTVSGNCSSSKVNNAASTIKDGILVIRTNQVAQKLTMTFSCLRSNGGASETGLSLYAIVNGNNLLNTFDENVGRIGAGGLMAILTDELTGIQYEIRMLVADVIKLQITGVQNGNAVYEIKGTSDSIKP